MRMPPNHLKACACTAACAFFDIKDPRLSDGRPPGRCNPPDPVEIESSSSESSSDADDDSVPRTGGSGVKRPEASAPTLPKLARWPTRQPGGIVSRKNSGQGIKHGDPAGDMRRAHEERHVVAPSQDLGSAFAPLRAQRHVRDEAPIGSQARPTSPYSDPRYPRSWSNTQQLPAADPLGRPMSPYSDPRYPRPWSYDQQLPATSPVGRSNSPNGIPKLPIAPANHHGLPSASPSSQSQQSTLPQGSLPPYLLDPNHALFAEYHLKSQHPHENVWLVNEILCLPYAPEHTFGSSVPPPPKQQYLSLHPTTHTHSLPASPSGSVHRSAVPATTGSSPISHPARAPTLPESTPTLPRTDPEAGFVGYTAHGSSRKQQ